MDKTFFSLGLFQKSRKVAPRSLPSKSIASPASNQHITVLACIGVEKQQAPWHTLPRGKCAAQLDCYNRTRLPTASRGDQQRLNQRSHDEKVVGDGI